MIAGARENVGSKVDNGEAPDALDLELYFPFAGRSNCGVSGKVLRKATITTQNMPAPEEAIVIKAEEVHKT